MITRLANRYFEFVAKRFPVMCASDEFHFLPMAEAAAKYYDKIDNLEAGSIKNTINELKQFRNELSMLDKSKDIPFEKKIDIDLLIANISGTLIEIEKKKSFRNNPLLYLKVAFIGLDHALNRPSESSKEIIDRVSSRLHAIPDLLGQGVANLSLIPESFFEHAVSMTTDCKKYLKNTVASFFHGTDQDVLFEQGIKKAIDAVDAFRYFLLSNTPSPDSHFSSDTLDACIREHFMSAKSLDDIFQIAVDDWNDNLKNLEDTGRKINPDIPWQVLYQNTSPNDMGDISIISRYSKEAENVCSFFETNGLVNKSQYAGLVITETPLYLRSIRGSASFGASLTADEKEKDFFYITTNRFDQNNSEAAKRLEGRLHREYKFLTAHETVPGHFLLDSIRRKLENPVRRQIESPLFYEGWATYAETMLADYGYVAHPDDLLVDFRRRLWRAARCQIDAGISTGKLDREDAVRLLTTTGFSREEANGQINRFRLNPGYQLCYCLGSYEIRELKKRHIHRLGVQKFHDVLLKGGELPFHLIEKRMEKTSN
ncbi:MAG: DUF885 family protein [Deltaproteobacteria bacterium]|nr:DUF885 family protein [Deltaproteobacteria bacterium]